MPSPNRELRSALTRAALRLEVLRGFEALGPAVGLFLPLLAGGVVGLFWAQQPRVARVLLVVGLLLLLARLLRKMGPRVTRLGAAIELDRRLPGGASFAVALAFSELPPQGRGPFHGLVIRQALGDLGKLRLSGVLPVRLSPAVVADSVNLVLVVALVFATGPRAPNRSVPPAEAPLAQVPFGEAESVEGVPPVDFQLETERGQAIQADAQDLGRAVRDGTIRREAALLGLLELEEAVQRQARESEELLGLMVRRGQALSKSSLAQQVGKSLTKQDLAEARKALLNLADQLARGPEHLSSAELEKLRLAVTAAIDKRGSNAEPGVESGARAEGAPSRRGDLDLAARGKQLSEKARTGRLSQEEVQEQEALERRLASLERRKRESANAKVAESALDEQLREAARALGAAQKKGGAERARAAARYIQGAAEALERLAPQVLTDDEKRALLRELKRQKARVQNGGPEGEAARAELREFERRARGAGGAEKKAGAAEAGELEVMASGASRPRVGAGASHDEHLLGAEARLPVPKEFETVDAHARAQGGPSEAEIVRRAARKGFLEPAYRQMYLEYEKEDEAVLARDHVPEGYRARVLRYFELIGPSGSSHSQ